VSVSADGLLSFTFVLEHELEERGEENLLKMLSLLPAERGLDLVEILLVVVTELLLVSVVLLDVAGDDLSLLIGDRSFLDEAVSLTDFLGEQFGLLDLHLGRHGAYLDPLLSSLVQVLQVLGDLLAPLATVLVVHLATDALGE